MAAPKKLFLAQPRGFCAGVRRALQIVENVLAEHGPPVYVLHEIVHNEHIVNSLKTRGVRFVERLVDADPARPLVFSAHGVSLEIESESQRLGLCSVDATCPLVKKIHFQAARLAERNYDIILIGHRSHPEIVGTLGHLKGDVEVIESVEQAEELVLESDKRVACLTQTTLSQKDVAEIIDVLRKKNSDIRGVDSLCYATRNRQAVTGEMAALCDVVFVIGSEKSSNSKRLRETAASICRNAYLLRTCRDIRDEMLTGVARVGVTAAASAPETLVKEMIEFLMARGWPQPEVLGDISENISFKLDSC